LFYKLVIHNDVSGILHSMKTQHNTINDPSSQN